METKEYFCRYVELLRKSDSTEHYFNHFPWQARIVIENILKDASDNCSDIHIFIGSFTEIYGKTVVDKLKELAINERKIEIILGEGPSNSNLNALLELNNTHNITVRYMKEYDSKLNHLWLAGNAYRFELPHAKVRTKIIQTSPECHAQFAFHNEEDARKVSKYWKEVICSRDLEDLQAA